MSNHMNVEEAINDLSKKHKAFADKYLLLMNGTRAYMAIYKEASYETAMVNSSRLLRNAKVATYLSEKMKEAQLSAEEAIYLLSKHAHGDIAELMEITSVSGNVDIRMAQERGLSHLIKKVKQKTTIFSGKTEGDDREVHEIEIELYDAQAAIDKILRVHGRYKNTENDLGELKIKVSIAEDD